MLDSSSIPYPMQVLGNPWGEVRRFMSEPPSDLADFGQPVLSSLLGPCGFAGVHDGFHYGRFWIGLFRRGLVTVEEGVGIKFCVGV